MSPKKVSEQDLAWIYQALLRLAHGEGCTVLEILIAVAGSEDGRRIYDEVF